MFEDTIASKILEIEENDTSSSDDAYYEEIRERNNYYQELISKNKEGVPHALNSLSFVPIATSCILEKEVLLNGKFYNTIIPKYNITREFIYHMLRQYKLFDFTEEESRYLLDKYFSDVPITISEVKDEDESADEGIVTEPECVVDEVYDDLNEISDAVVVVPPPPVENSTKIKFEELMTPIIVKRAEAEENYNTYMSSIKSYADDEFNTLEKDYKKENDDPEKIDSANALKNSISLFLKEISSAASLCDKKVTIITFLERKKFRSGKIQITADIFNIRDEKGQYIFNHETIDEWYKAIMDIEEKQKSAFECSQFIISICLFGIEYGAKKLGIEELSDICSEIKDPTQLPTQLVSTKRALTNLIDDNLPSNCIFDFIFFVGNVYLKNKTGFFK